ncbi:DUF4336 domain-containing protein [Oscillatoria sp. CS-180]|uniref:DUF4336 domain-containing protein n=1 Tax=Oscillatoria sp. CS-180 TaxID=3021720 RepID=UPI00232E7257|nr:DUF4336 domain-containing protein [Oscillatoria sp. CS-180]MDB9527061.1 DUF4336 domain-containing protein [Oscillatoria sp. CS-180]
MGSQGSTSSSTNGFHKRDRAYAWPFWPAVPLYPYGQRPTLVREVVKDTLWTFDQYQGIFYVVVPIRMTVVKLRPTGLLVYSPVAPTPECIRQVRSLEVQHGPVRYILMTTTTGIEHKVFVGPFARKFPQAEVYVAPNQWSYPINLPLSWLGLPPKRTHILTQSSSIPFADQFDCAILGPIRLGLGPFVEVALFHRDSRTLLLTDAIVSVPFDPPPVLNLDPYPLLFHSRDRVEDPIVDTPEARRRGWHRIALFSFFFRPSSLHVPTLGQAIKDARKAPDNSRKAYFGLYPFQWKTDWQASFQALHGEGRPFVAPVLQTLIFNRDVPEVQRWVNQVAQWQFERAIPCHLSAPISMGPAEFQAAFGFIQPEQEGHDHALPGKEFEFLQSLESDLVRRGITPPASF